MKRRARGLAVLLAAPALLAAACAIGAPAPAGGGTLALFDAPPDQRAEISVVDLAFEPAAIELSTGALGAIAVTNRGKLEHDFTIDRIESDWAFRIDGAPSTRSLEGDVHIGLRAGVAAQLRLRPLAAGRYEFYCSVPGHRNAGMRGELIVR